MTIQDTKRFAVLDDDSDAFLDENPESNFKTTFEFGLTDEIKDRVIAHLIRKVNRIGNPGLSRKQIVS